MHGLYFQAVFVESMGLPKEVLFLSLLFLLHFFWWKFSLPSFMNKEEINERKSGFGGRRQPERRGLEGSIFYSSHPS